MGTGRACFGGDLMTIHGAENRAQNTQNGAEAGLAVGSVYFVHDSGRVKTLLAELRSAGVILSIEGDRLAYDAPAGAITDDRCCRMRADRDGLLALLRPEPVVDAVAADPVAVALLIPWPDTDSPPCPRCGVKLVRLAASPIIDGWVNFDCPKLGCAGVMPVNLR